MRLSKIKLVGFKSFVDPTTIHFPSSRVGIVGPNGCGKSNVIDAVRWVMGEASAKHLRGDSMADVIFNGSNTRKPVGTAAVELVFDNADGAAGGQYASYAEIAIKRSVSRDGTSSYYLNGTRCRRRDITDIFLGTGLGPRSYAIIEQGMISRLIEAKPEELRVFLEEAAGISKYKERRRETENRIRHTRENLDRLNDLREEIEKQIEVLHRQARAAERYKTLAAEARQLKAEVLALKYRELDQGLSGKDKEIGERENALQAVIAGLRHIETLIEKSRTSHTEAQDAFSEVQGRFYSAGADIARVEQAIQHGKESRQRQEKDLAQAEHALGEVQGHLDRDTGQLDELTRTLQELEPALQRAQADEQASGAQLQQAEQTMQDWQTRWETFNQQANDATRAADVERTRIEHIEQQIAQALARRDKRREEQKLLSVETQEQEIRQLQQDAGQAGASRDRLQGELETVLAAITRQREDDKALSAQLHSQRSELENLRGRLASLEALQQAALGKSKQAVNAWLQTRGLDSLPRLAEKLQVETGWERAVETVLGFYLEAVCVEELDSAAGGLQNLEQGAVALFEQCAEQGAVPATGVADHNLAAKVHSSLPVQELLTGVQTADSLAQAQAMRGKLGAGQSVITRDGIWLGPHWLRVNREEDERAGVLAREQEIRAVREQLTALHTGVTQSDTRQGELRQALKDHEARREELQTEVNRAYRQAADSQAQLNTRRTRLEQTRQRLAEVNAELADLEQQIKQSEQDVRSTRGKLELAITSLGDHEQQRSVLIAERDSLRTAHETAQQQAKTDRDTMHELAVRAEGRRSQLDSTQQNLERMRAQHERLSARRQELQASMEQGVTPQAELQTQLDEFLNLRGVVESELTRAREKLEALDEEMRSHEQQRTAKEHDSEEARAALEALRLGTQEMRVRRQTLNEQLQEMDFNIQDVFANLPEDATTADWQQRMEQAEARIQRLGNINMAAIDQYEEQVERKTYLDAQYQDLTEALTTLENAIHKIDRETRTRFKETFDRVNSGLQTAFPRLFGGGHAYLEMTGDDLLDAGVTVMARPPGKRNSTIHLLSGGEKALTAVALVFAIFELNPAPFCMLDEVDAPLDDANVGRFCDLVQQMSERVQFVFITHNKATMEMADQLTGVTMHEPGVSRLVAVDVEEAVQMAAM